MKLIQAKISTNMAANYLRHSSELFILTGILWPSITVI
jgi:hypothetical protein